MAHLLYDGLRGAIGGFVATWLMDEVTTGMLSGQPKSVTEQERQARPNGESSTANLADLLASELDVELTTEDRTRASTALHWALGIVPGAVYGMLRDRVPGISRGHGMLFGALVWAANDEWLNAKLGLSGPWGAYPVQTHARGLVGHLVLGATTDTALDLLPG